MAAQTHPNYKEFTQIQKLSLDIKNTPSIHRELGCSVSDIYHDLQNGSNHFYRFKDINNKKKTLTTISVALSNSQFVHDDKLYRVFKNLGKNKWVIETHESHTVLARLISNYMNDNKEIRVEDIAKHFLNNNLYNFEHKNSKKSRINSELDRAVNCIRQPLYYIKNQHNNRHFKSLITTRWCVNKN